MKSLLLVASCRADSPKSSSVASSRTAGHFAWNRATAERIRENRRCIAFEMLGFAVQVFVDKHCRRNSMKRAGIAATHGDYGSSARRVVSGLKCLLAEGVM